MELQTVTPIKLKTLYRSLSYPHLSTPFVDVRNPLQVGRYGLFPLIATRGRATVCPSGKVGSA